MNFCELGLSEKFDPKDLPALRDMGYRTVAFDRRIREGDPTPEPPIAPQVEGLTVLNRLTVEFAGTDFARRLARRENLARYDLVAVAPTTPAALQHACSAVDADIITYDPADPADFKINRRLYGRTVERGTHFELLYSPALKDSGRRRALVKRAHAYFSVGKSANVLLSSGAENVFQARRPRDLINLGLILALGEERSKSVLIDGPKRVLLKSDSRRCGKVPIFILEKIKNNKRQISTEDPLPLKKLKPN